MLDARGDEANVAKARAQLARDEVGLADARRQLARSRELLAQNFISQGAVDTNQALVDSQAALVAADRAAIEAAGVALSYARITAPSAGRAGAINVFPGSAVQANQTSLVTITQLDPIGVAFNLPQRHLADALAALKGGGAAVSATLPEGGVTVAGRLQFVDNAIDPATGTVKVKAQFENRDGKLWPGAFVNIAMTLRTIKDALVVPQAAIIQGARGPIVYAVQDDKAVARPVQVLYAQGEEAAVSGVKPGERIVLDGRQNLRPGAAVVERAGSAGARAGGARRRGRGLTRCGRAGLGVVDRGGPAMNLSELFIRRPVMTVLLNAAIVLAGVIGYPQHPGRGAAELRHAGDQRVGLAAGRQPRDHGHARWRCRWKSSSRPSPA